jgi:hypothetical protein
VADVDLASSAALAEYFAYDEVQCTPRDDEGDSIDDSSIVARRKQVSLMEKRQAMMDLCIAAGPFVRGTNEDFISFLTGTRKRQQQEAIRKTQQREREQWEDQQRQLRREQLRNELQQQLQHLQRQQQQLLQNSIQVPQYLSALQQTSTPKAGFSSALYGTANWQMLPDASTSHDDDGDGDLTEFHPVNSSGRQLSESSDRGIITFLPAPRRTPLSRSESSPSDTPSLLVHRRTPFFRTAISDMHASEGIMTAILSQLETIVCRVVYCPGSSDPLTVLTHPTTTRLTPHARNLHRSWLPLVPGLGVAALTYFDALSSVLPPAQEQPVTAIDTGNGAEPSGQDSQAPSPTTTETERSQPRDDIDEDEDDDEEKADDLNAAALRLLSEEFVNQQQK